VRYRFELARDVAFSDVVVRQSGLTAPSFAITSTSVLERGRRYYWRVAAIDGAGNAGLGPATWFDVRARPLTYDLAVREGAPAGPVHIGVVALVIPEYAVRAAEQLTPETTYHWQVDAIDAAGNRTVRRGFFDAALDQDPLIEPLPLYPRVASTLGNIRPTFEWSRVDHPTGIRYTLEIAEDAAFTRIHASERDITELGYTLSAAQALARGRTYYWRVRALNGRGTTVQSQPSLFTVGSRASTYSVEIAFDGAFTTYLSRQEGLKSPV
jgi:hypothetical protein